MEPGCNRKYPVRNGFPILLVEEGDLWVDIEPENLPLDSLPAMPTVPDPAWLARKAQQMRITILQMVVRANGGHIGGAYSVVDVMTALYFRVLKHDPSNPAWPDRDRLIFSKGHGCLALYVCLAESGYFRRSRLLEFGKDGGLLGGHPERGHIPGVEITAGSLGHGLPQAVGMSMAAKMDDKKHRLFVVMSDGECNEGSVWEGFMAASQHKLSNLTAIIDSNKMESLGRTADILNVEPLGDRLRTFGWGVREIDGHDMNQIVNALEGVPFDSNKPSAIVANTVKGKGVSFMEGISMWHLRGPTKEEAWLAFSELARGLRI
jgi:transketolase